MIFNILMALDVPWSYGPFSIAIWAGFFLGILHIIMPCEDKFIFCFYALGVARDWKQAFRIVNFYGLGLFLMNLFIGIVISFFGAIFGSLFQTEKIRFFLNGAAAFTLILSGAIMFYQIKKKTYWPHSEQFSELTESISTLKARKRTGFLLGLLAGIPPCLFETGIYIHAINMSIHYGWGNGVWMILFFGIGTWIGLYPLALIGNMSNKISKIMKNTNTKRIKNYLAKLKNKISFSEEEKNKEGKHEKEKENENIMTYSSIEFLSAGSLIFLGILFLFFAIFRIDLIPHDEIPSVIWPFTEDNIQIFWIIVLIILGALFLLTFGIMWWKNKKNGKIGKNET